MRAEVEKFAEIFLEGDDFESVIRLAVFLNGDSDTLTTISGSIAEAYYGIPSEIKEKALLYLDNDLLKVYNEFQNQCKKD